MISSKRLTESTPPEHPDFSGPRSDPMRQFRNSSSAVAPNGPALRDAPEPMLGPHVASWSNAWLEVDSLAFCVFHAIPDTVPL